MTALDGKDATIPCEAEGAPSPNVTWFFNGKCAARRARSVVCTVPRVFLKIVAGRQITAKTDDAEIFFFDMKLTAECGPP